MESFLKKDIRSFLFVISLTFVGIVIAFIILNSLTEREYLGIILVLASSVLTTIGLGLSIQKSRKNTKTIEKTEKNIR